MAWTTLAEEATLIDELASSGRFAVDVIGESPDGTPIRLLRVGIPPKPVTQRAMLLCVGLQHGTEPAGREAILQFAEYLDATSDPVEVAFLQQHGVMLVPTMNPDGLEIRYEMPDGTNLNRDHIALTQDASQGLARVLRDARPVIVTDHHEAGSGITGGMQIAILQQVPDAVDPIVRQASQALIDHLNAFHNSVGRTTGPYQGQLNDAHRMLHNTAGLRNSMGFLAEGWIAESDEARIDKHLDTLKQTLLYAADNAENLLATVDGAGARRTAAGASGETFTIHPSTVLDPAPLGYQLTGAQVTATTFHRDVFGITLISEQVSMAQPAQPIIPFLFDPDSGDAIAEGERLFSEPGTVEPTPAPVAVATIRREVTWLGCSLATGRVIQELPDITGEVSRVICRYTSSSAQVPIPLYSPNGQGHARIPLTAILQSTDPARAMLVAVVNDIPTWAGIVLPRRGGTAGVLDVGLVSIEGYLDHRFVRDHTWKQQDEASVIATGLLRDAGDIPGVGVGLPLTIDAPPTGRLRDRTYLASDHKTVYEALVELSQVRFGPEWTIDLDWADDTKQAVRLICRVRPRIGKAATNPAAVFQAAPGSVFSSQGASDTIYEYLEDRSGDRYANYVIAYSSGEGEDQPTSEPAFDTDALGAGTPIWEKHFQPSTSITDLAILDNHAQAELDRVRNGANTWQLTARWDAYPRYGVDWQIGDDIAWELTGHRHPSPGGNRPGVTGRGRAIGFSLNLREGTITPILQEP